MPRWVGPIGWALAVGLGVALVTSGFLSAWDGRVVAVAPVEGVSRRVIIDSAGRTWSTDWPAGAVDALSLVGEGPRTVKRRFTVEFTVEGLDRPVPTTSPATVELAVLGAALAGLAAALPRGRIRPLAPAGAPAPIAGRPKNGPPPPRPSVGRGRR